MNAVLLAGCASVPVQVNETSERVRAQIERLRSAPCCTPLSGITYVPISKGESPHFQIDESSPIVQVLNGKAYAGGIEIPPRLSVTYLTVRGFGIGIWAPSSTNFLPAFLFFDGFGAPLKDAVKWSVRPARADWNNRSSLEALIELPPSKVPTRVLVYADPAELNKRTPKIVDAGVFMVPNGPFGSFRVYLP